MDPDENLKQQLAIAKRMLSDEDHNHDVLADAGRLAELVVALDEWLTMGGSLPAAWKPGPNR